MSKYLFYIFVLFVTFNLCYANNVCSGPLDGGLCYGHQDKYGFNEASGKCEYFVYGGCGGNDNRYDTMADCQSACEK